MAEPRDMKVAIATMAGTVALVSIGAVAAVGGIPIPGRATPTMRSEIFFVTATPSETPMPLPTGTPTPTPTGLPSATQTRTPTPPPPTGTPSSTPTPRRMTNDELTLHLQAQVASQRAQFEDGQVRFMVPDRVILTGRMNIRGQPTAVEATLQFGVQGGRARITSHRITAGGQPAAPEAQASLTSRVAQTNAELDAAVPRSERVRRVVVTPNGISGEMEAP